MSDYDPTDFGCSDEHIPAEFEEDFDSDEVNGFQAVEIDDDYLDEIHPPLSDEDDYDSEYLEMPYDLDTYQELNFDN